jgi:hypothetical protein
MATGRNAVTHAGTLYRKTYAAVRHPVRGVEAEVEHLREVEEQGESGETPLIAVFGVILFLIPILVVIAGLCFAAYYIAR